MRQLMLGSLMGLLLLGIWLTGQVAGALETDVFALAVAEADGPLPGQAIVETGSTFTPRIDAPPTPRPAACCIEGEGGTASCRLTVPSAAYVGSARWRD